LSQFNAVSATIIEDTPAKSAILQTMLSTLGIEQIRSFEMGEDGLKHLSSANDQSVLFLDLMLPDISGQEILQHLARNRFKGFVIINSLCETRIVQTAVNIAANSGIRLIGALKPDYTLEHLEELLRRCVQGPYSRRAVHADHVLLDESAIHRAFDEDRITPFYQPIINMATREITMLECLARVISEDGSKVLSPVSFIGPLIGMAFLDNLSLRLFGKALNMLNEPFFASSTVKLAMNIEPTQLLSRAFPTTLHALTAHAKIKPERVIFELTEQSPINQDAQLEAINILRLRGYDIAIDDFGSGYTNIENLHSIPFNKLKIDRQLLHNITEDSFCQVAVESILSMAEVVGAEVVFEGIEHSNQLHYSEQHRNVCLQGHYLCEAVSAEQLVDWIENSLYSLA
jgi:EAL domain-containing protein (putative c-di-GMP-specific phosphodiesterase class I)/CheY-like chemotaxis protein